MKYVPNILSFLRFALCPVFIVTFFKDTPENAFLIFLTASLLDIFDGFIARKFNAITNLGKIIDPIADKALQLSAIICFALKDFIPFFVIIILGLKELTMVIGGGIISKKQNNMVYSNAFGKIASFITSLTLCLMFFTAPNGFLHNYKLIIDIMLYLAVSLSIISMIQYGIISLLKNESKITTTDEA